MTKLLDTLKRLLFATQLKKQCKLQAKKKTKKKYRKNVEL